ncbi:radical SAM/SPASM domain-containing protein [Streptomyces sp. NBC_01506]|uniref:radical SAM/SPASM domain-containing protein n=1 Tax=Streptomyces sp. NBC_01506 TaxID=2903887 RepID=UPI003867ED6A
MTGVNFAWLEITGKCQLECAHCYADSGPRGTHGTMESDDWRRVIEQLASAGATMVQFIGGEPMLHPELSALIEWALHCGLRVEVFSNLVHVPAGMWPVLERPGVSLATSYYSDDSAEHAAITGRPSYARTRADIAEAVRRSIPIRAGIIDLQPGQRVVGAHSELTDLGIRNVGTDRLRQVGRGVREREPDTSQLCGRCMSGVIAVSPDGAVWPCVFSRWLPVGNVLDRELVDILSSPEARQTRADLEADFATRKPATAGMGKGKGDGEGEGEELCDPRCGPSCGPACNPSCWPTGAGPCSPNGGCRPNYD